MPPFLSFPGACDCQMLMWQGPTALELARYNGTAGPLGLQRFVVVQPEANRFDDTQLTEALAARRATTRGVAAVSLLTPEATLEQLYLLGVRGLRLQFAEGTTPQEASSDLLDLTRRAARRGFHVEITASAQMIAALAPAIRSASAPVVIARMAGAVASLGLGQPGLDEMLEAVAAGRTWVKLNGIGQMESAALPVMRALIATNVDQLVWGGDWPADIAASLALLIEAAGTGETLRRILVDNPARLYGFDG